MYFVVLFATWRVEYNGGREGGIEGWREGGVTVVGG